MKIIDFAKLFKDLDIDYCQYKPEVIQVERNSSATKKIKYPLSSGRRR